MLALNLLLMVSLSLLISFHLYSMQFFQVFNAPSQGNNTSSVRKYPPQYMVHNIGTPNRRKFIGAFGLAFTVVTEQNIQQYFPNI